MIVWLNKSTCNRKIYSNGVAAQKKVNFQINFDMLIQEIPRKFLNVVMEKGEEIKLDRLSEK